jgi:S1-C subfamily serine protease
MQKFSVLIALFLVAVVSAVSASEREVIDYLQAVSCCVKTGDGEGTGVIFTRGDTSYVWTAAHVVASLRHEREVIQGGTKKTIIEFDDAAIVQECREIGRCVGEIKMAAKVIRYSDATKGEDLAVLEIRKRNFTRAKVEFAESHVPELGTKIYHVGCLLGQFGANSLTSGIISQVGRVLNLQAGGTEFDQTTAPAYPGSSGGGIFYTDGRYVGMLVRGADASFNFIVPIRRMRAWAKRANVEWAMDIHSPVIDGPIEVP